MVNTAKKNCIVFVWKGLGSLYHCEHNASNIVICQQAACHIMAQQYVTTTTTSWMQCRRHPFHRLSKEQRKQLLLVDTGTLLKSYLKDPDHSRNWNHTINSIMAKTRPAIGHQKRPSSDLDGSCLNVKSFCHFGKPSAWRQVRPWKRLWRPSSQFPGRK